MIGSDLLSESNKLCKHSDLDATRRLEELQSEFAEAPPIFTSLVEIGSISKFWGLVKTSLQDFSSKEMYLNPKNRSVSFQKRRKMSLSHHFQVFTLCHFQNVPVRVPFSKSTALKSAGKTCVIFV